MGSTFILRDERASVEEIRQGTYEKKKCTVVRKDESSLKERGTCKENKEGLNIDLMRTSLLWREGENVCERLRTQLQEPRLFEHSSVNNSMTQLLCIFFYFSDS